MRLHIVSRGTHKIVGHGCYHKYLTVIVTHSISSYISQAVVEHHGRTNSDLSLSNRILQAESIKAKARQDDENSDYCSNFSPL